MFGFYLDAGSLIIFGYLLALVTVTSSNNNDDDDDDLIKYEYFE
jgi:hypothetical protein